MNRESINELVKLKIKTHYNKENKQFIISKEELIQFCIDLIKTIEKCN